VCEVGVSEIGWTITSNSLLFASLLPLGGRAADLLSRRRVFFAG
jgi:MFS family permease